MSSEIAMSLCSFFFLKMVHQQLINLHVNFLFTDFMNGKNKKVWVLKFNIVEETTK